MKPVNYGKTIHKTYAQGRALSSSTMAQWMEIISKYLSKNRMQKILDIGSGTGRFSIPLAECFEAWVIGLEPSEAMRRNAKSACRKGYLSYLGGKAENIPFINNCFDAVFASMAIHHFNNITQACQEIARVLKPAGYVFIRNSFKNRLNSVRYYDFFPSAKTVDNLRLPNIKSVVNIFQRVGLSLEHHMVVKQRIDDSLAANCNRIKLKTLSSFEFISKKEFKRGIIKMEKAARNEIPPCPVFENIDMLILKKKEFGRKSNKKINPQRQSNASGSSRG